MSKNNKQSDGGAAVLDAQVAPVASAVNNTVHLKRADHPPVGNPRCTFVIEGVSGVLVIPANWFVNGVPQTLTFDAVLPSPKVDGKAAKEAAAAQRLIDKALKAQAKIEAAQAKAVERQAKADAALAAARAKVEAAAASATA